MRARLHSVEFTIVPFRDADQRMVGIAVVMRDVTAPFEELRRLWKLMSAPAAGG